MSESTTTLQDRGRRAAIGFLENRGLTGIKEIEHNSRTAWLVAQDGDTKVVVEVRVKQARGAGVPDEGLPTANALKLANRHHHNAGRVDLIAVYFFGAQGLLRYIRDAVC